MTNMLKTELIHYLESLEKPADVDVLLQKIIYKLKKPTANIAGNKKGENEIREFLRILFFDTQAGEKLRSDKNFVLTENLLSKKRPFQLKK